MVKCLPSRQEDLSLTSIAHEKKAAFMTYAWNTSIENVETDRSRGLLTGQFGELLVPVRGSVSKNEVDRNSGTRLEFALWSPHAEMLM